MPSKTKQPPKPAVPPVGHSKSKRLSPVMAEIADQVAELLIHGESRERVEMIVKAAALSKWGAFWDKLERDASKRVTTIADFASKETTKWMEDLTIYWRENRRAEPADGPDPVTVTDRIRAGVIDTLHDQFDDFLRNSNGEERMLLHDVFVDYDSCAGGDMNELVLAHAFQYQVDYRSDAFIRCPEKLQKQVQTYIDCLKAAEPCKDKAAA